MAHIAPREQIHGKTMGNHTSLGVWIALGAAVGAAVGVALGQMPVTIGVGIACGIVIGHFADR
jgi:predicted lysophospholipase L1 biosynthesis ABC-type transport system permease subunit